MPLARQEILPLFVSEDLYLIFDSTITRHKCYDEVSFLSVFCSHLFISSFQSLVARLTFRWQ